MNSDMSFRIALFNMMFHIDYQDISDHPGFSITHDILIVIDFHVKHTVLENGDVG